MEHVAIVSVIERACDLLNEVQHLGHRQWPSRPQARCQRAARGEFGDEVRQPVCLVAVVDNGQDVGMIQLRNRLCFALEALLKIGGIGQVFWENLDRRKMVEKYSRG